MTQGRVKARVSWVDADAGGRSGLPTGSVYSTVARFPEDEPNWRRETWSIVLESSPPPAEQGNPSIGVISFLSEDAPDERLRTGRSFVLYEGARRVATVEIIGAE